MFREYSITLLQHCMLENSTRITFKRKCGKSHPPPPKKKKNKKKQKKTTTTTTKKQKRNMSIFNSRQHTFLPNVFIWFIYLSTMETTGWYLSIGMGFVLVYRYCCNGMLMMSYFGWGEVNWLFNVTINDHDISVIHVIAHRCAFSTQSSMRADVYGNSHVTA